MTNTADTIQKSPNILEIRGNFIGLLAEVNDPLLLQKMLQNCLELMQTEDNLDDLSPATLAALEKAVAESYDETNLVPAHEAKKMTYQWLKQ